MSAHSFITHRMFVAALGGNAASGPRATRIGKTEAATNALSPRAEIRDVRFSDALPVTPAQAQAATWALFASGLMNPLRPPTT
ncbi:MAG: hypothetical protein EPO07_13795 [Verrucomicrobia bacterium]|nr:MAG: hypothetical protein EPO07_13795 [Verrucomicrobiota bacterium]